MNKQEIIDRVGREKYAAASAWFRTDSVSDDYGSNSHLPPSEPSDSSIPDLPREIKDWIWESEGSLPEQLVLLFSMQILSQLQLEGTDLEALPTIKEFLRKQD